MYGLRRLNPKIPYVLVAVAISTVISWATGFEHDTRTPLQTIMSQEARDNIANFNAAVGEYEKLGVDRANLSPKISQAEETFGKHSLEALDLPQVRLPPLPHPPTGKRVARGCGNC